MHPQQTDDARCELRYDHCAMPTPAERKALLFLAGIIVLGASVKVVRAARHDGAADESTRQALARQLSAIDSLRKNDAAGVNARARPQPHAPRRIGGKGHARNVRPDSGDAPTPVIPLDLDVAPATEIEALPRIGPVLAKRIVEDRMANGPFGSLGGFERVHGVGHALALALRDRVTFSGTVRPSNAVVDYRLRSRPTLSPSHRRERKN